MVQALSNDLRKRVIKDVEDGLSRRSAARKYRVSPSFVIKLVKRYKDTGRINPLPRGGDRRSYLGPHADFIQGLIAENSSITLRDISVRFKEKTDIDCHISILDRFIRKMGYRYKKNGICHRTKT